MNFQGVFDIFKDVYGILFYQIVQQIFRQHDRDISKPYAPCSYFGCNNFGSEWLLTKHVVLLHLSIPLTLYKLPNTGNSFFIKIKLFKLCYHCSFVPNFAFSLKTLSISSVLSNSY